MPVKNVVDDALGVVTISFVAGLGLVGLLCILYSFYFQDRIRSRSQTRFRYFSGPLIVRIVFILLAIWWGFGEIIRLEFLRRNGRLFQTLDSKWQETVCKCYIVSNLGFSEPCLFVTLVFLLRASLQNTESGPLSQKWNFRTIFCMLLCILPLFVLQLTVVLVEPSYKTDLNLNKNGYFFKTTFGHPNDVARCFYPLLSTIFLGLFVTLLTVYLLQLGRQILTLVINKGLRKRVYTLIFFVTSCYPLRVLLLGLTVLFNPGDPVFEVIAFLAFLSLLSCIGVWICILVYFPVADSLALKNIQDTEALIANHTTNDDYIAYQNGSISFREMERDVGQPVFVELSLFSPSSHLT